MEGGVAEVLEPLEVSIWKVELLRSWRTQRFHGGCRVPEAPIDLKMEGGVAEPLKVSRWKAE